VRLIESASEATSIDALGLAVVDRDPGLEAFAIGSSFVVGSRQQAYRVVTSGGTNVLTRRIHERAVRTF
jgi:hypothetical protein